VDKEEEFFHKIAEKLSKKHRLVKTGKMMSSPGISYKKKFFESILLPYPQLSLIQNI